MNDPIKFSEVLLPDKAANKLSQAFTFQNNMLRAASVMQTPADNC